MPSVRCATHSSIFLITNAGPGKGLPGPAHIPEQRPAIDGYRFRFRLRSASYGGKVAPPIPRANWDLSCEVATCRGRSVDQRTDGFTPCDVVFSPWFKTSGQNLIWSPKRQRRSLRPARCARVAGELPRSNCCNAKKPALFEMLPTHTESFIRSGRDPRKPDGGCRQRLEQRT
jgi:hypothetical protein